MDPTPQEIRGQVERILLASTYQYSYDDSETLLEEAEELGRRAVALDPNCQPARFTVALVQFSETGLIFDGSETGPIYAHQRLNRND